MKPVLTIAGSDSSGGAGIQADLKTFMYHNCFGMSVITAITSQNTLGVTGIHSIPIDMIKKQLEAVVTDIFPNATKIGMVDNREVIAVIKEAINTYELRNVVLDPVMVSTSGSKLITEDAIQSLVDDLIPLATVITPNIFEAEILTGMKITGKEDMLTAAKILREKFDCVILIKGGHLDEDASDLVLDGNETHWLTSRRMSNKNTHGTGCTLSSAIASNLAMGYSVIESIRKAKGYITSAIGMNLDLGKGRGPLCHTLKISE